MSKVYVKFPKTGLGNLLLVWARAYVFAQMNDLPLVTSSWWGFRWGAWIRNERKKRLYWGTFKESSLLDKMIIKYHQLKYPIVHEPVVAKLDTNNTKKNKLFLFDQVITDNDLFGEIRSHQELIKDGIFKMLNPKLKKQLDDLESPVISVHIRRGDFKIANPITPESFFIEAINKIRSVAKEDWPVTVFTDAASDEISNVLALPNMILAEPKADIMDILLMSGSKVIIMSRSSTFSYWAAFLSNAVCLISSEDWQQKIKDQKEGANYREIKWKIEDENAEKKLKNAIEYFQ